MQLITKIYEDIIDVDVKSEGGEEEEIFTILISFTLHASIAEK